MTPNTGKIITGFFDTSTTKNPDDIIKSLNKSTVSTNTGINYENTKRYQFIDNKCYDNYTGLAYNYITVDNKDYLINSSSFERGIEMENNNLLEKYIEKVDRDQSDLRSDIRTSEERTSKNISEIQQRMDNRLNRIEDLISKQNESIDTKLTKLEDKIDDNKKFMRNIQITIIVTCAATILGAAALGFSLAQIVEGLVSLVK